MTSDAENHTSGFDNIKEFERSSALILAKLYEVFPVPSELAPSEIDPGSSGETQELHAGTIEFLRAEGYLRYQEVVHRNTHGRSIGMLYSDAVLTAKGLAVLNTPHDNSAAASDDASRGKRLMDAMRSGAIDIARTIVRALLSEGVKSVLG
jgi:hypothetical protein